MIKLTVALPVFNSKDIAWLAMESLCRQKAISFEWELIICEEANENAAGQEFYSSYTERLQAIGCQYIKFIPLQNWIPLAQKWRLMGIHSSKTSVVYVLQAADCYSHPYRLFRTFKALSQKKYDWYQAPRGFFYHIFSDKLIIYDHFTFGNMYQYYTALNMATLTEHARRLPLSDKRKGVDGWFLSNIHKPKIHFDRHVIWKEGVDTQGLNNLSKRRAKYFDNIAHPFTPTAVTIDQVLPADVLARLMETKDKVKAQISVNQPNKEEIICNSIDDVQDNTPISFVYVWLKSEQVWNELAYSIKSIRKFYKGKFNIFVVGDNPGMAGVTHIPAERVHGFMYAKSMDGANKLKRIIDCQAVSENFVYMYDDIIFLKPVDISVLKLIIAHDNVEDAHTYFTPGVGVNPSARWQNLFIQTWWMLKKRNMPTYNYETHLPRVFNKQRVKSVMDRFNVLSTPCLFNTLYFNSFYPKPQIELNKLNKYKAGFYRAYDNDQTVGNELRSKYFLNYDDAGLNDLLKKHILKILNS